jgi:hypothetical protein
VARLYDMGSEVVPDDRCSEVAPAEPCRRKRSVEYLLEGESVKTNRHLARFAASPYLNILLEDEASTALLSRSSRSLRKEIIEAYAVLEQVEGALRDAGAAHSSPATLIDLCSGKGFLSVVLALEFPAAAVLMVDSNASIKLGHVSSRPNLHFLRADVLAPGFGPLLTCSLENLRAGRPLRPVPLEGGQSAASLARAARRSAAAVSAGTAAAAMAPPAAAAPSAAAAGAPSANAISAQQNSPITGCPPACVAAAPSLPRPPCVVVGMHLCGPLSPRAVELFGELTAIDALILAPCCLDKR